MKQKDNLKYKVYIYGEGNEYNKFASYLFLYQDKLDILGLVTTEKSRVSSMDGCPCITVEEIDKTEMDYIIIAVKAWREIADILSQKGIDESKIILSTAFFSPFFDLDKYLNLKNSNVSILSNTCLGGMVYNELGLKILSPTIKTYCPYYPGKDFLEFAEHYEYYLEMEMEEYGEQDKYVAGTQGKELFVPKGIIGDKVIWQFPHAKNAREAVTKWNERAKRVNLSNIVVLMALHNDDEAYQFAELKVEKKLGVYYKDLGLDDVIYCPVWNEDENFRYRQGWIWAGGVIEYMLNQNQVSPVDWIKFLGGEKNYRRF